MKKNAEKENPRREMTYKRACKIAAHCDFWYVEDAARLLLEVIPHKLNGRQKLSKDVREAIRHLSFIIHGSDCIENPDVPEQRRQVIPKNFITWAGSKGFPVPEALSEKVRKQNKLEEEQPSYQRRSSGHRYRCRVYAERLWKNHPAMTISEMTGHPDLVDLGCEGKTYSKKTIHSWIKDLCPDRSQGRRPKQ